MDFFRLSRECSLDRPCKCPQEKAQSGPVGGLSSEIIPRMAVTLYSDSAVKLYNQME